MALSIKDPEADRLVRELASATGESITEAARRAFAERLQRVRAQTAGPPDRGRVADIIERARRQRLADGPAAEEILGYDDLGLPR